MVGKITTDNDNEKLNSVFSKFTPQYDSEYVY